MKRHGRAGLVNVWAILIFAVVMFSFMYYIFVPIIDRMMTVALNSYASYTPNQMLFFTFIEKFIAYLGPIFLFVFLVWTITNARKRGDPYSV